jgi:ABC-type hemin transport system substrate-binding protein
MLRVTMRPDTGAGVPGDFASLRARLDAIRVAALDDEEHLRSLRRELDELTQSLADAREAADAASVELQLRRLRAEEPHARAERLRGLLEIYAAAIEALEEAGDHATATLILRLALRQARVADELAATERRLR